MHTITDPDWRQGDGRRPLINLDAEMANALQVWDALYFERITDKPGSKVAPADLDAAMAREDRYGARVRHIVWDATTRPLPTGSMLPTGQHMSTMRARWEVAQELAAITAPVDDAEPGTPVEDTCRHGVPFAGDCDACEEDL